MTKVLIFGIGMLLGAGLTAYFFVAIQHGPAAASALAVAQPPSLQLASAPESDAMPPANAPQAGSLIIPVDGIRPSQLTDNYNDRRGDARPHEALDIMAPRGTPVLAAADGKIVKLFDSKPGGLTIYEFDSSESVAYYYAHLDRYAPGIAAGLQVKQGEVIGYVGSTGNASPDAPHLHFAIFRLGPEKNWWQGTPINPYPLLAGR
jgi:peptidoglycan LD-endopeptidase LytH